MLADSHTHILDSALEGRAEQIIECFKDDGIDFIVEISASPKEAEAAYVLAKKHESVYCTMGVHPAFAPLYTDAFERWAERHYSDPKVVAIGECGLDYHYEKPFSLYNVEESIEYPDWQEIQKKVFIRQIKLADNLGLPLVIHSREAFEDTFQILQEHKNLLRHGVLFHCFCETVDEVKMISEFDAYVSFSGAITYKNNTKAAEAIQAVPLNRILVETDCPYLTPVPLRGKVNEPRNVQLVAAEVAKVLNRTVEEISQITLENTKRFYKID